MEIDVQGRLQKNPALKIADPSGELNQTTYRGKFELFEILCTI
jgi:hypothetical protein